MIFLIDYDRKKGELRLFKQFRNDQMCRGAARKA